MNRFNRTIIAGLAMLFATVAVDATAAADTQDQKPATTENSQKPTKKYYMQVCCSHSAVNGKVSVEVNLGRMLPSVLGIAEADLRQATSSRSFPTEIDAVNFYAMKGWTLVDSYTVTQGRATSVCYVMMFETADPSEVGVSILTH